MNGNKMSGRTLNGKEVSGEMSGKHIKEVFGRETTDDNVIGNIIPAQVPPTRATQVERTDSGKKKFPFGWLLPVAPLSFFVGYFWSYLPVVHGIVSLFVISKFCGTHFLL